MKRRDFIYGLTGVAAGFAISELMRIKTDYDYKNQIPPFGIALTSHCNLNCKSCDTFAPISKEEFLSFDRFYEDFKIFKRLYNAKSWNGCFTGGEPLLHPDLEKIIERTYELLPKSKTAVLTNGILLNEKDDSFWRLLKKYNVALTITKYPINIDRDKYEEKAKKYNVSIKYNDMTSDKLYDLKTKKVLDDKYNHKGNVVWAKPQFDLSASQNYKQKIYTCPSRGCYIYERGRLYACYFHSNMKAFADYFNVNILNVEEFSLLISSVKSKEEIIEFLEKPNPLCKFCKYCHSVCYDKGSIEWDFSENKITEWI